MVDEKNSSSSGNGILFGILAYIIPIIMPLVILLYDDTKGDKFLVFHAKQSLSIAIIWIVALFIGVIPIFGWIVAIVLNLVSIVYLILGLLNVLKKKMTPLPLIGQFADQIKI